MVTVVVAVAGVAVAALVIVAVVLYRSLITQRHSEGTVVIVRSLPAEGGHGWRYGSLIYDGESVCFKKLATLQREEQRCFPREDIRIREQRTPQQDELPLMDDTTHIVRIEGCPGEIEIAFTPAAHAAFLSWIESRPSERFYDQGL